MLVRDQQEGNTKGGPTVNWFGLFKAMQSLFARGFSGTITIAKLTTGGTEGSITFVNGVVTSSTAAT
jgi:hypothetical protein